MQEWLKRHPIKIVEARHTPNVVVPVRGKKSLSIRLAKKSAEIWCNHNVLYSAAKVMVRPCDHEHANLLKLVSQEHNTTFS